MEMIISHKSALEYWRLHRKVKAPDFGKQRRKISPPARLPHPSVIRGRMPSELPYPIILLVGNQNAKRKSRLFQTRVYTGEPPVGCFTNIDEGLAVSTPPFCFFQMACELPLVKLIELGFELCGTYSLPVSRKHGNVQNNEDGIAKQTSYKHPQLTNTKAIKNFTSRMEGVSGQKKACRALRYIADGSGSPMETILFMLLTLPQKLGGYGLPTPELNKRIDTPYAAKNSAVPVKEYYVCDLFWPEAKLAVEYDNDLYHTGADRIAKDSNKRLDLKARGITVITVTNIQIRSAIGFDRIAKTIAGALHKRLQYANSQQFQKAKRELRRILL
ncbi:MAG: endonuclease domain-containing protein [Clostridiales bacterium]|nr:endonuclease domain-containing protein [Clostridiales bacterium]